MATKRVNDAATTRNAVPGPDADRPPGAEGPIDAAERADLGDPPGDPDAVQSPDGEKADQARRPRYVMAGDLYDEVMHDHIAIE